ncbi:V-set and immunoglobulin domain-containing protein 10-like isoform X1 [Hippoglossus hippoglossus]|uniref:V-set and immunoglobulin domain-containing protein 10-like isoform X1 n=1 Tax=Hippoglossus hippoglossus TaxID=8267 RepID=UPI00148E432F|nr:V-set and immunoglobulin domain-containing protein 10-like isoform X1 [Hippoglossus hippoglossus]
MASLDPSGRLTAVFLVVSLSFSFQGAHCKLVVAPVGPTWVNARAGSNVTLAFLFSGAPDPVVTWFKGALPVLTWTIGSSAAPDIGEKYKEVLKIEKDGSLTFVNVQLDHAGNYTMELTKSGLAKAETAFTLNVFENIQNVELTVQPDLLKEGIDRFLLQYRVLRGEVEQQRWLFNGTEIKTSSHYTVKDRSLEILNPNRTDTGRYTVVLKNPLGRVEAHRNITVLYGPDEPRLEARPAKPFYVPGDSLSLVCQAGGSPRPTATWVFGDLTFPDSQDGVLNRTNVQISQGGVYTCKLTNQQTKEQRQKSMILNVYEKPSGDPICSVQSVNVNAALQYHCQWPGGTPLAQLSFPELSNSSSGAGNFSLTVTALANLNWKTVTCMAVHPVEQNKCNITASRPVEFLPTVRTSIDSQGKIVVAVQCVSDASPQAVVSWSKGSEAVANGGTHKISSDTTQLKIRGYNVSNFVQQKYSCTCRNPLGSQRREIQLQGPSISDFSLFPNPEGTIVTLTWEVLPTSIVTGFDIQVKGPNLPSEKRNGTESRGASDGYRTIQRKPGSARSADVLALDPNLSYRFRVIPRARMTEGEPSEVHRLGPGEGLSGPAIAGIAAGIPCSLLFLVLLGGSIYLCVKCNMDKSRPARYPVSRAAEKVKITDISRMARPAVITTQSEMTPHHLLTGGLKSPPDYNKLQQTPSERSVALPTFVPPPPVRVATTV